MARRDGQRLRLCNLVAPGATNAQGRIQARCQKASDGKETEPWEILYFKVYKSQLAVIEQALETAALMLWNGRIAGLFPGDRRGFMSGGELSNRAPRICCSWRSLG